jgi:3-dehydroquinate synthase
MAMATNFSAQQGRISSQDAERVLALLKAAGLELDPPAIPAEVWLTHMARDKKNENGQLRLTLLDAIGRSSTDASIDASVLKAFLADV